MIEVIRPGALCTVQDLGRSGYRQSGLTSGGALDALALAVGNRLVGNSIEAAGLEITFGRAAFRFHTGTRIALTGAECAAQLDGQSLPAGWSSTVRAGQVLVLDAPRYGTRAYLCVMGGVDVPVVLGSRSTDLGAGFGGLQGRALAKGDRLQIGGAAEGANEDAVDGADSGASEGTNKGTNKGTSGDAKGASGPSRATTSIAGRRGVRVFEWIPGLDTGAGCYGNAVTPGPEGAVELRTIRGPEYTRFDALSQRRFWSEPWRVTPASNRMGYRLSGTALSQDRQVELLSHAVLPGTVQVPPDGQPIVLLGDAQTTGGFPKIGSVIIADWWRLAQTPLGAQVRFVECTPQQARDALRAIRLYLRQISIALNQG